MFERTNNVRKIDGLLVASWTNKGWSKPKRLPKGAKGRGLSFERKMKKFLDKLDVDFVHDKWISFVDLNGAGMAQPDFLVVKDDFVLLIECKLRESESGYEQMLSLYKPLVEMLYNKPVYCLQVVMSYSLKCSTQMNFFDMLKQPKQGKVVWRFGS